jgi:tetratricopeptide (TPR) repeat protein
METLVTLELAENQWENAERRLQQMLAAGISMPFCYSRLAELYAGKNDLVGAIGYAEQALASGPVELDILVLLSDCLEKTGRIEKAEAVLSALPGSGCGGGGAHVLLAEFWLRHGKSLPQALEAFKSASRQDPGNLRWPLRIAQTCLAQNRHKEGRDLLEKILCTPDLPADLRQEAEKNFSFYGK